MRATAEEDVHAPFLIVRSAHCGRTGRWVLIVVPLPGRILPYNSTKTFTANTEGGIMGKEHEQPCKGGDDCTSDAHLCKIARHGDMELIRQLVREPRFFCRKCGRAAREEVNLCRPAKI